MVLLRGATCVVLFALGLTDALAANYSQLAGSQRTKLNDSQVNVWSARPSGFFKLIGSENEQTCEAVMARLNEREKNGERGDYSSWPPENSAALPWVKIGAGWVEYFLAGSGGESRYVYRVMNVIQDEKIHQLYVLNKPIHEDGALLRQHVMECKKTEPSADCSSPDRLVKYAIAAAIRNHTANFFGAPIDLIELVTSDDSSKRLIYSKSGQKMLRNVGDAEGVRWQAYKIDDDYYIASFPVYGFALPEILVFKLGKSVELKCLVAPSKWN